MKFIEVVGKKFKLASRFERLYAFFIDGVLLAGAPTNCVRFSKNSRGSAYSSRSIQHLTLDIRGPKPNYQEVRW